MHYYCSVASHSAQTLSRADRKKAEQFRQQIRDQVVETLEHIVLAEDYLLGNVTNKVMKGPERAADRDTAKIDAIVMAMIPDRSHKAQAPPTITPTGRWAPDDLLDRFLKTRAQTNRISGRYADLRAHASDSPTGQQLHGYEWLLFIGADSQRHTKQISEVKADRIFRRVS